MIMNKEPKRLVTINFRYNDRPINEHFSGATERTITIGIYDTLDEAIKYGNEAIKVLSKYFEVRPNDKFAKNYVFGKPNTLVSNCCYPTHGISYFAKITPLYFDDLTDTIQETFKAYERYKQYQQELEEEE